MKLHISGKCGSPLQKRNRTRSTSVRVWFELPKSCCYRLSSHVLLPLQVTTSTQKGTVYIRILLMLSTRRTGNRCHTPTKTALSMLVVLVKPRTCIGSPPSKDWATHRFLTSVNFKWYPKMWYPNYYRAVASHFHRESSTLGWQGALGALCAFRSMSNPYFGMIRFRRLSFKSIGSGTFRMVTETLKHFYA